MTFVDTRTVFSRNQPSMYADDVHTSIEGLGAWQNASQTSFCADFLGASSVLFREVYYVRDSTCRI